ncbi:hypothetical protein QOZ80_9AG0675230 [Eleusine coracana subsp. coracana]|nr:hypothetical protein QOZ80_9AG0675230 [Eleusine coracana subsp. coracana]
MSTASSARQQGGGGVVRHHHHQFPVGRRRYVPVVDAGCGCRPRRPRLLSLPSFLKSGKAAAARRSGGGGERYSSSATSTASFSSSCAATRSSTGGYSSSAYSSSDNHYYAYGKHAPEAPLKATEKEAVTSKKKMTTTTTKKKKKKKKMASAAAEEEEDGDVGVAVEKESCDPRADFRESMVQMVVEMGLCDWDGLRCMLRRLLALNAPRHHAAILTAFAEVCAQIIAAPAAASSSPSPNKPGYHQYRRS